MRNEKSEKIHQVTTIHPEQHVTAGAQDTFPTRDIEVYLILSYHISLKTQISTSWWREMESQRVMKVISSSGDWV